MNDPNAFLGEFTSECLTIKDWLTPKCDLDNFPLLYKYLLTNGKSYERKYVLSQFPKELPKPKYCGDMECHKNSMLYIKQLQTSRSKYLSDIQFATGFVKGECAYRVVEPDLMYGYVRHSFLLYKGNILDITYLKFPQDEYDMTQYWGVTFHHSLMRVKWNIDHDIGISIDLVRFLMRKGGPFMVS